MKRYYSIPFLGKRLLNQITKSEGGEKESTTLRNYYKSRYNVEIDLYSYGGCFEPHFNMGGGYCENRKILQLWSKYFFLLC